MSYKTVILRLAPGFVHQFVRDVYFALRMLPNYFYDFRRFLVYSGVNKSRGYQAERAARITLFYHQVEKGLSLANPRPGFGMTVIPRLLNDVDAYISAYGLVMPATTALAALQSYVDFNTQAGQDASYVRERLAQIKEKHEGAVAASASWVGGVISLSSSSLAAARAGSFANFFESRFSIRNFAGGVVPEGDIRKAVALSQKTPSVCNRQSWRVHAFSDQSKMQELLEIQSGSRGFSEHVSTVLVVTSELGAFVEVAERYQAWIDGGMFSMSLCLALHDLGYGTCCLNWSKERDVDRALHAAADVPDSEQIIMLIAVGNLPERFNVARSFRPPVDHCLRVH
jgi:nitroreductase